VKHGSTDSKTGMYCKHSKFKWKHWTEHVKTFVIHKLPVNAHGWHRTAIHSSWRGYRWLVQPLTAGKTPLSSLRPSCTCGYYKLSASSRQPPCDRRFRRLFCHLPRRAPATTVLKVYIKTPISYSSNVKVILAVAWNLNVSPFTHREDALAGF